MAKWQWQYVQNLNLENNYFKAAYIQYLVDC